MFNRGVAICTYNRAANLEELIESTLASVPNKTVVVICDDGSTDGTFDICSKYKGKINYYGGLNKGVAANKNRALFALKDCHMLAMIEDDLFPVEQGWFELYEKFVLATDIHHLCRVQAREIPETVPSFTEFCKSKLDLTPIYSTSPRGDLTFLSQKTLKTVGAMHPRFRGCGMAHGQWSERCRLAGLTGHPLSWVDVKEARDKFIQKGDTQGGRWADDPDVIKDQIAKNREVRNSVKTDEIHIPLYLP